MATIKSTFLANLRTKTVHLQSGVELLTDAPTDNHGEGASFSPTDLVTVALTNCILTTTEIIGQTKGFSIEGATAETTKIMADNPRRISGIEMKFQIPDNGRSEEEKKKIRRYMEACPVGRSIHPDLNTTMDIEFV